MKHGVVLLHGLMLVMLAFCEKEKNLAKSSVMALMALLLSASRPRQLVHHVNATVRRTKMIGWLVLIAVVVAFLIYIAYDDFDTPDDNDACPSDDAMCCGGGCYV